MVRKFGKILRVIFYLFVVIAGVSFAVSNRSKIDLTFFPFPYTVSMPIFMLAAIILLIGVFVGWSLEKFATVKYIRSYKESLKRIAALENEISGLRAEKSIDANLLSGKV